MSIKFTIPSALILIFVACNQPAPLPAEKKDMIASDIDSTTDPKSDFFDYANGAWFKRNPIPADEVVYGIGELVENDIRQKLRTINEQAVSRGDKTGVGQQVGDFWYSANDSVSIEKNGIEPLREEMNRVAAMKTLDDAVAEMARIHAFGVGVFFDGSVSQDLKNSNCEAFNLSQGGLGMPNREYYFNMDDRTAGIRDKYVQYVATVFRLLGADSAQATARTAKVITIETLMATASRKLENLRDPYKNYNKYPIVSLRAFSQKINWVQMLTQMGVNHVDSVIVGQPEFFTALGGLLTNDNLPALKDYMTFHLVSTFSPYVSKPFADAHFDFYGKTLAGAQQMHPMWRRALDAENAVIGEELGQLFVKQYFGPVAKARYEQVVENVRNAFKARMEKLDWMDDSTRQKAIHKLLTIKKKVGYPDKWKDFSALKIDRGPYVLNMMRAFAWWNSYMMDKLGKPVNRDDWEMTPQTYNAYYNQSNNEIVLPAAQMCVPGYADSELDDALVYGYTAASTIGHEITHGFDDEGRKYDENGNLCNWWSLKDSAQFTGRSGRLAAQFSGMVAIDTFHINGKATLGENLADLGGILIGLDAFKQTETYKKGTLIHGETPLQRFFLGYALGWLLEERPQRIASQILTDVHAPAKFRVNGPLPNVPEFYDAFGVKSGDKLYIEDSLRVRLW